MDIRNGLLSVYNGVSASVGTSNAFDIYKSTSGYVRIFNNGRAWFGGGTPVDAGYQADINGTARIQGPLSINTTTVNNLTFDNVGTNSSPYMRWLYYPDSTNNQKTLLFVYKTGLLNGSIYIAPNSQAGNPGYAPAGNNNYVFGGGASLVSGSANTLIGYAAGLELTSGASNTLIGQQSGRNIVTGRANIAIASGDGNMTIGDRSNTICVGNLDNGGGALDTDNAIVIGGVYINNMYIGAYRSGVGAYYPGTFTLNSAGATTGSTNNIATTLRIAAGKATGNAIPADLIFSTTVTGSSGTIYQTLVDRWYIKGNSGTLTNKVISHTSSLAMDISGLVGIAGSLTMTGSVVITGSFTLNGITISGSGVSGGATNYIPLFTSATSLSSSVLYQSAGNIGIGTTSPDAPLRVAGAMNATHSIFGNVTGRGLSIQTVLVAGTNEAGSILNSRGVGSGTLIFQTDGTERVRIAADGNVGIGNVTPRAKLDVEGAVIIQNNNNISWGNTYGAGVPTITATSGSNASILFYPAGSTSGEKVRVTNVGDVYIGTTSAGPDGNYSISPQLAIAAKYNSNFYLAMGVTASLKGSSNRAYIYTRDDEGGSMPLLIHPNSAVGVGIGTTNNRGAQLYIEGGSFNWNENIPSRNYIGTIHLDPTSSASPLDNYGNAITFGGVNDVNGGYAQAGIYVRTSATYGTKMYLATTDNYTTGSKTRLFINNNGDIGIGTTSPTYKLELSTDSAAKPSTNTWTISSDSRIKTNIQSYTKGLEIIKKINPVSYDYNGKAGFDPTQGGIGIIAQDVKDILPESISSYYKKLNPEDENETELYNFNSHALTYVLINAIKEQQTQIEELKYLLTNK